MTNEYQGLRVYVAGPLNGSGDFNANVRTAEDAAASLRKAGFCPFVPHVNSGWMRRSGMSEAECLAWDFAWLDVCDILVRLLGVSPGSDAEVRRARARQMIVIDLRETVSADGTIIGRRVREALGT